MCRLDPLIYDSQFKSNFDITMKFKVQDTQFESYFILKTLASSCFFSLLHNVTAKHVVSQRLRLAIGNRAIFTMEHVSTLTYCEL